jgi:hypothetical protein
LVVVNCWHCLFYVRCRSSLHGICMHACSIHGG